jgi:predicted ABC-class ATPase
MLTQSDLTHTLNRIDGRGYKAYKDIQGSYHFGDFTLYIDYVQGDPFAAPSKVRVRVPQQVAGLPPDLFHSRVRSVALRDFLARRVAVAIRRVAQGRRGSGKSGAITIDASGQEVLERTAAVVTGDWVEARLHVGLPAAGRSVLGRQATEMLVEEIPRIVRDSLLWKSLPEQEARRFVACVENQEHIRAQLDRLSLVSFIADGSLLPRESGASDRPLPMSQAIPFRSPASLSLSIDLPNPAHIPAGQTSRLTGMGIPKGITLILGGGYHGKSTLLQAVQSAVYPHIPGDGREYVVTSPDAVKIRAEDGRRVTRVDISPFIRDLPYGRSTSDFSTDDASGSTSQAASILEALEVGATVLLLDEDTSATNFMVRDARMQALVHRESEPITPFIDRVRELYDRFGVSTVLVMGGSGDYFDVADTVIMMRDYLPHDVTEDAHRVARGYPTRRQVEATSPMSLDAARIPVPGSFDPSRGRRDIKIDARALDHIQFGAEAINLRGVEQLVDWSQSRATGYAIHLAAERYMDNKRNLRAVVDAIDSFFDQHGLDPLDPFQRSEHHPGDFARPRKYEIAAAINRLRTLSIR